MHCMHSISGFQLWRGTPDRISAVQYSRGIGIMSLHSRAPVARELAHNHGFAVGGHWVNCRIFRGIAVSFQLEAGGWGLGERLCGRG